MNKQPQNVARRLKQLRQLITARSTEDGDGVKIHRIAGRHLNALLDPFLLIDEINSDDAADYMGGFPPHPHRGFETITYMLEGRFRHRDSLGNEGVIEPGGVQWMSAARGVIHSEMPEQDNGRLHGFQVWLNLPAVDKLKPAAYREFKPSELTHFVSPEGLAIKAVAGEVLINGMPINGPLKGGATQACFVDITLPAYQSLSICLPYEHQALVYVFGGKTDDVDYRHMAVYGDGDEIRLQGQEQVSRLLLLAGKPIAEPIAQQGPFVMNTMSEINQAIEDYRNGCLVDAG